MSMQATIVSYVLAWDVETVHNLRWHKKSAPAKSTQR